MVLQPHTPRFFHFRLIVNLLSKIVLWRLRMQFNVLSSWEKRTDLESPHTDVISSWAHDYFDSHQAKSYEKPFS